MPIYFPVWHSHCTRASFTVLVSCRDELRTAHSCPLICLQRQVAKRGKELFHYWPLLRSNNMATNSSKVHFKLRQWVFCRLWLLNAGILASNAAWQLLLIAVSQIVLYCVKRSKDAGKQESDTGISLCSFKRGRRCIFHHSIVGNYMVYQVRIETNLL